jgi:hypothetical protein
MQTFLPFADYRKSAAVLDRQRLGKQRVEAKQILNALAGLTGGWVNHPAVRMWRGYEGSLSVYGLTVCVEWVQRGYKDSLIPFFAESLEEFHGMYEDPPWLGNRAFHRSHKSNLLRKDHEWYGHYFRNVPDDLPYVWPVQ